MPLLVSIHAPGRGATDISEVITTAQTGFNSRTREGCDNTSLTKLQEQIQFQFTHPGGVRPSTALIIVLRPFSFNSRTREGCDTSCSVIDLGSLLFQFTHPGGVRRERLSFGLIWKMFQFTHPGGVRQTFSLRYAVCGVSIHAPGRGATVWCKVAYYGADKQA